MELVFAGELRPADTDLKTTACLAQFKLNATQNGPDLDLSTADTEINTALGLQMLQRWTSQRV